MTGVVRGKFDLVLECTQTLESLVFGIMPLDKPVRSVKNNRLDPLARNDSVFRLHNGLMT